MATLSATIAEQKTKKRSRIQTAIDRERSRIVKVAETIRLNPEFQFAV